MMRRSYRQIERKLTTVSEEDTLSESDSNYTVVTEDSDDPVIVISSSDIGHVARPHRGSVTTSIFQLANSAVGAGILAFPYAFHLCGLAVGVVITVYMGLLACYTQFLVVKAVDRSCSPSYEHVVHTLLGSGWSHVLGVVVVLFQFGTCTAYLLVIYDQINSLLQTLWPTWRILLEHYAIWCRTGVLSILALFFCLPVTIPRRLHAVRHVAILGVIAPLAMCIILIGYGVVDLWERGQNVFLNVKLVPDNMHDVLHALPLMFYALQCHIAVPMVYTELRADVKNVPNMNISVAASQALVIFIYISTGFFGHILFGDGVSGDVMLSSLVNYHLDPSGLAAAKVLIALGALASFPVKHMGGRNALLNLLWGEAAPCRGHIRGWVYWVEAVLFVTGATVLAICVPFVSTLFAVLGASGATIVMLLIPALLDHTVSKLDYQLRSRIQRRANSSKFTRNLRDDDQEIVDMETGDEVAAVHSPRGTSKNSPLSQPLRRLDGGDSDPSLSGGEGVCAASVVAGCQVWIIPFFLGALGVAVAVLGTYEAIKKATSTTNWN